MPTIEVISARSAYVALFESGEHQSGGDDVSDPGLAGDDALQGSPTAGQQRETRIHPRRGGRCEL